GAEGGLPVGPLDRHHPYLAGPALDRGLGGIRRHRTAADDDHVTAAREIVGDDIVRPYPEEFHRGDHFGQVRARDRQDAAGHHPNGEEDRVIVAAQLLDGDVLPDILVQEDVDSHVDDHLDLPEQLVVVEAEVRNAGRQQAAELGLALVQIDAVSHQPEVLGLRLAVRYGSDDDVAT